MAVSQADGGTRSGLLWEVERILGELENLPQILIMENVPEVIGTGNIKHFEKWENKLTELGYTNYIGVLNGKNYLIPQNRRRCFMVSLLGDYAYDFPVKQTLKYRLKDFLEKNVDEKYFLTKEKIDQIQQWNGYEKPLENIEVIDERERTSHLDHHNSCRQRQQRNETGGFLERRLPSYARLWYERCSNISLLRR